MATKNILIVGSTSYIGKHCLDFYQNRNATVLATTRNSLNNHAFLNLEDPNIEFLENEKNKYDVAIICGAIPNIVACEQNPTQSYKVNVLGTLRLCELLISKKIKPVVFSSDIVFDGKEAPYDDTSLLKPINEYGQQKKLLEEQLPRLTNDYLILRLTKTYSIRSIDNTLLFQLAEKLYKNEPIRAASDLFFNPICVDDVVEMIHLLIENKSRGTYNLSGPDTTSWYHLANLIAQTLNLEAKDIEETSIDEFSGDAKRAKNLTVYAEKFKREFPQYTPKTLEKSIQHLKQFYKPTAKI